MTNQFVFGNSRWACLEDLNESALLQYPNGTLYSRFGQPGLFGQLSQAQCNTFFFLAIECCPKDNVNQESRGSVIVTSQIGQKHVNDVFVNRDMQHCTIA